MGARSICARAVSAAIAVSTIAVAALGHAGCASPKATAIMLVVTSEVPCTALDGLAIAASAPDSVDTHAPSVTAEACKGAGEGSSLGSLLILPSGAEDAEIALRVMAGVNRPAAECNAANRFVGCVIARRVLRFVPHEILTVTVPLRRPCTSVACDTASTCVEGQCRNARCTESCDEASLGPAPPGPSLVVDAGPPVLPDGAIAACAADEKRCEGRCVAKTDARYGCGDSTCVACTGAGVANTVCNGTACGFDGCAAGYKLCAGNCVPADPLHGCRAATCAPCESANGVASCAGDGSCALACGLGTKLCGGRCVRIDDPTYGCGDGCTRAGCQDPGAGTLVCSGPSCVIGTCPAATKKCGSACVPLDATNGCADGARCTACATGDACLGTPAVCTCVAEPLATTCATHACGPAINNCGTAITCPNTCGSPNVCGGGGAGPSGCGCTPDNATACAGKACGSSVNNCGTAITCPNTCVAPFGCGIAGAGPNACGCTPDDAAACVGKECGPAVNNCGTAITCPNTCSTLLYCGGGGVGPNKCGCTVIPQNVACTQACGIAWNGCNEYYSCGPSC